MDQYIGSLKVKLQPLEVNAVYLTLNLSPFLLWVLFIVEK